MECLARLRSRSCIIEGKPSRALESFERIRYRQHDGDVFLYPFDLIELDGDDMRRDPLQVRKVTLASILAKARPGRNSSRAAILPIVRRVVIPGVVVVLGRRSNFRSRG